MFQFSFNFQTTHLYMYSRKISETTRYSVPSVLLYTLVLLIVEDWSMFVRILTYLHRIVCNLPFSFCENSCRTLMNNPRRVVSCHSFEHNSFYLCATLFSSSVEITTSYIVREVAWVPTSGLYSLSPPLARPPHTYTVHIHVCSLWGLGRDWATLLPPPPLPP